MRAREQAELQWNANSPDEDMRPCHFQRRSWRSHSRKRWRYEKENTGDGCVPCAVGEIGEAGHAQRAGSGKLTAKLKKLLKTCRENRRKRKTR